MQVVVLLSVEAGEVKKFKISFQNILWVRKFGITLHSLSGMRPTANRYRGAMKGH